VSAADNPLGFVTLDGEPEAAPFESIPAELREQDRWVVWRWERDPERPDEPRKPPYRADAPDQLASSTKPETWASFEQAAARSVGRADGIGFALGPPYVGIDLDEELPEQEHGAIMLALDSYSERSPSGRGHHVIVKASLNGRGRHAAGIGVFQDARFFYCTGQRVQGTPATIEERQEQLELVLAEYLKPEPRRQLVNGVDQFVPLDLGDHELLERAIAASNGIAFRRLWEGDTSGYPSRSEADLALCAMLAFWTGPDPGRIDSLFRHSGLMRDKWLRDDYREHTLARALGGRTEFYAPRAPIRVASATTPRLLPAVQNGAEAAADQHESFTVCTARDLCQIPDPPASDRLLGPLVLRGSRTIIGGSTGEGKTSFALAILAAIVAERELLGWTGAGGRGLVIDLEQGIRTAKLRLNEIGLADSDALDYVRIPDGLALGNDPAQAAAVEQILAAGDYAGVLLDPYYKAHRGDSNEEGPTRELMRLLDRWRETYRFGLILPAHTRKPVEPGAKFTIHDIAGSAVLVRGAEVILGIRRLSEGYSRLFFFKDRDDVDDLPVDPLGGKCWGLLFDKASGFRRDPKDEQGAEPARKAPATAIAAWINEQPDGNATPGAIRDHFGIADSTLRSRREQLADLGITYVDRGRDSYYTAGPDPAPAIPRLSQGDESGGQEPHGQAKTTPHPANPAIDEAGGSGNRDLQGNRDPADPALSYREDAAALRGSGAATPDDLDEATP
jgi:putative DNA primase/helicase